MKLILNSLLTRDMACSDLATMLDLSKPALTKITTQMLELDLITTSDYCDKNSSRNLGRKKTYLTINKNNGVVAGIDFSTVNIKISVNNLTGETIVKKELVDFEFIDSNILEVVRDTLKDMLESNEVGGRELLCLCIGASGKVNKKTGEIVSSKKFFQCKDINLKEYFEKQFNIKVLVKNDIDLSMYAETKFGSLKEKSDNAILMYIDSGLGGAIMLSGQLIFGAHGYAGEFGLAETFDSDGVRKKYDVITSINAIKDQIREYQDRSGDTIFEGRFRYRDVVQKFFEGNEVVKQIVFQSAARVGELITNLVDILDIDHVVISGRIKQLNSEYLDEVKKHVNSQNGDIDIVYSDIEGEGIIRGAICFAIEEAFDILILRRKNYLEE